MWDRGKLRFLVGYVILLLKMEQAFPKYMVWLINKMIF